MRTGLTCVFIALSCLLFGGLVGHRIGFPGRAKLTAQRDKSLKLAEEYKDLLDRAEKAATACVEQVSTLRILGTACCEAAQKSAQ